MKPIEDMELGELAAFISSHLKANGIECVLSGGACVSIYTNNEYQSYDLDFIEFITIPRKKLIAVMTQIGFNEENRYFTHPDTKFFVEFPTGPLAIGSQPVKITNTIVFSTGELLLLTPTDCVKDRLAAYYYWDDLQSLDQALLVAESHAIEFKEIKRWSKVEGQLEKFNFFIKEYTKTH